MDKKRIMAIIVVLILIAGGFAWYFFRQNNGGGLIASGTIEGTEVVVSSKAIGKVLAVKVDEGDQVKAGDIIALIDRAEVNAALRSAQAKYDMAKSDYERAISLYKSKMISSQQFDFSRANYESASAALDAAKISRDNTEITAPISGVIMVRAIEPGELAGIGAPIVTMADLSEVKLMVYISEKDVGKIQLGQKVSVSVDSYPDRKFIGKVIYISERAEFTPKAIQTKEERTMQVFGIKIKIPNPDQKLKPGMPADAEFKWNSQ